MAGRVEDLDFEVRVVDWIRSLGVRVYDGCVGGCEFGGGSDDQGAEGEVVEDFAAVSGGITLARALPSSHPQGSRTAKR